MKITQNKTIEKYNSEGMHFNQKISITQLEFDKLQDCINAEIVLNYPHKEEYTTNTYKMFLKPLLLKNKIAYLNLTQLRFISLFIKYNIIGQKLSFNYNTYLSIVK
jgi:hypothetical protein